MSRGPAPHSSLWARSGCEPCARDAASITWSAGSPNRRWRVEPLGVTKVSPSPDSARWTVGAAAGEAGGFAARSEEHTSELQSLMRTPYAVLCLKKKNKNTHIHTNTSHKTH